MAGKMYRSTGIVHSTATRGQKPGWFFLSCDAAIGDYYRWLYGRAGFRWQSAMNGVHVTFISGEKDARIVSVAEMRDILDTEVEFEYSGVVYTNTRAFWIPVVSERLQEIRRNMGLPRYDRLHLTLGNMKSLENSIQSA